MKVLVMAKSPVPGAVKTRMCPPLDEGEAAELATSALADTLGAVAASGANERWIALDGAPGDWLPPGFRVIDQRGSTFSARLQDAWDVVGGPTLQIGMDTPQVSPALLDNSCAALLDSPGAVLGHAHDGGWWALGMHQTHRGVFAGIAMSTPETGSHQSERLRRLGLGPRLLPLLRDVDQWEDALAVARDCATGSFARTVTHLASRKDALR